MENSQAKKAPQRAAGKRPYNSSRRKAQAAETRGQILEAARVLFAQRGYAGTTIEAIARRAGTATETVYAAFGSKRAILTRLVDFAVLGDEGQEPLLERPGPQAVARDTDQRRQLRAFSRQIRQIMERVSPLFEIMRAAGKTEPEVAGLLTRLLEGRRQGMLFFVGALARNGPLRPGIGQAEAADTAWALTSAEVYRLFTVDRGWSKERYEGWLAGTLEAALLP